MNTTSFFSICGLVLSFIFLTQSCPPKTTPNTPQLSEDCYPDRETTKEMGLTKGSIQKIGTIYALVSDEGGRRFGPCNLDKKWEVEGKRVVFSGLEKKILPYERLSAVPFVLRSIAPASE